MIWLRIPVTQWKKIDMILHTSDVMKWKKLLCFRDFAYQWSNENGKITLFQWFCFLVPHVANPKLTLCAPDPHQLPPTDFHHPKIWEKTGLGLRGITKDVKGSKITPKMCYIICGCPLKSPNLNRQTLVEFEQKIGEYI